MKMNIPKFVAEFSWGHGSHIHPWIVKHKWSLKNWVTDCISETVQDMLIMTMKDSFWSVVVSNICSGAVSC